MNVNAKKYVSALRPEESVFQIIVGLAAIDVENHFYKAD